jgi:hypothetical protein
MDGFQLRDERLNLSVEKGTETVPNDGRFHVLAEGQIVLSTRVEAAALAEFEDLREQRNAERDARLRALRGETAYDLMRSQSWNEKGARDSKRGGRGIGR